MSLGAVVLCGGESRRMGSPKAWLPFGDERLLQRVVRLAGTVAHAIVVVAAPGQELPELPPDVTVVRDAVAARGPLQGLAGGFAALPRSVELAYATATDVPFLEPRWISRLAELAVGYDIVIPRVDDLYQPLAALYRKDFVLPVIERMLAENCRRLTLLVETLRTRVVDETELRAVDLMLGTLRNLNRPEDYREALDLAGFKHELDEPTSD
jgi:molybdopterin-guanine dinucleotide biosynthesis protein A